MRIVDGNTDDDHMQLQSKVKVGPDIYVRTSQTDMEKEKENSQE